MTLLGNGRAFAAFERGDATDAIVAGWQADLAAFASRRRPFLFYP